MKTPSTCAVVLFCGLVVTAPVRAGGAAEHFSESLEHSAQAIGHSAAAGFKVVFAAVAIPLLIAGEIGQASGEIGEELWEEANRPIGEPLTITEEVVIAGPAPAEAVNGGEKRP